MHRMKENDGRTAENKIDTYKTAARLKDDKQKTIARQKQR
jgi:hypothetical protein